MNLKELKDAVDRIYATLRESENPEEISVVVELSTPSVGPSAAAPVTSINKGVNFEAGRVNIHTAVPVVPRGSSKNDVVPPQTESFDYSNYGVKRRTTVHNCAICGNKVGKSDKYCRFCGQKLR